MRINFNFPKIWFLLTIQYLLLNSQYVEAQTYGLKFNAQDVTLDKRTELDLTPDGFFKFRDEFEISFDYKTTRIEPNSNVGFFGYVFRIINEEDNNIDLLSTPTPAIGLNLVIGKSNTLIPIEYPHSAINNWIKLRVKFFLAEDKLIFYTPDTFYVYEGLGFRNEESFKIIFGANNYKHFKNTDVPCMTIKDLEIAEKGKLKYYWPLDEKEGVIATDKIKRKKASVFNPSWQIQNHQNWQKIFEDEIEGIVTVTSDNEKGNIFIIGEKELTIFSDRVNDVKKIEYKNKPHFFDRNYRAIFNTIDKKIYCYVVDNGPYFSLDTKLGEWNNQGTLHEFETRYRHHNNYFCADDTSIYVFGGYGLHRYYNEILKIDLVKGTWNDLPSDTSVFFPRYLAGLGALNDTIYILGGYGSKSGNQLVNPQSYFDLIGYSVKNGSIFKKFEIPHLIDDMIVGNKMWINESTRDYYALIFNKIKFDGVLQLIRGNLDSPDVEMVGDKIPFNFLDIRSVANLYYMPQQNKLYTYTSYAADSVTQVSIYSIDNPPYAVPDRILKSESDKKRMFLYLLTAFLFLAGLGVWVYRLHKRKGNKALINPVSVHNTGLIPGQEKKIKEVMSGQLNYQVILFGGFQVFNRNMEDITNKFSPLLKELFLLVLLNTFKNNKGITSDKISELLWYDKPEKSARNNRAVNIAKLRTILEEIGSCELSKKTGYWKILFKEEEIKSDYIDFLHITSSKKNLNKQKINQLVEITQKGGFLINLHYDWLDDYKSAVSDAIVDTLVAYAQSCNIKEESEFIIHIADSIFNFDVINEDAMFLKCRAEYCMGRHSIAKATYEKFFKEYGTMYGTEYNKAFPDIIKIKE